MYLWLVISALLPETPQLSLLYPAGTWHDRQEAQQLVREVAEQEVLLIPKDTRQVDARSSKHLIVYLR